MTFERAKMIRDFLEQYEKLQSKGVDAIGWIALKLSTSRSEAEKQIKQANKRLKR